MISQTVQVNKTPKGEITPRHAEFSYEFPESTSEALEKYGEALTLRMVHDAMTLIIQGPARKALEAAPSGLSNEEYSELVGKKMEGFQVNVKRPRGTSGPKLSAYQQTINDLADPTKRDKIVAMFRSLGLNLEPSDGVQAAINSEEEEVAAQPTSSRRR
jgi:hypothetical protein